MAALRLDALRTRTLGPLDLTLVSGERVFVAGTSGSGKSLLLRAIVDLDPHQGEVWLDTVPRSRMEPRVWRRRVGLLPAESFWWADEVGMHLQLDPRADADTSPSTPERGAYLMDWLAQLGFESDVLDWSVARLSTGERQRLALVRLLAQWPDALLLDETTANLDPLSTSRVETLVESYRALRGAAVLWVSHDPDQRQRLGGRSFLIQGRDLKPELPGADA